MITLYQSDAMQLESWWTCTPSKALWSWQTTSEQTASSTSSSDPKWSSWTSTSSHQGAGLMTSSTQTAASMSGTSGLTITRQWHTLENRSEIGLTLVTPTSIEKKVTGWAFFTGWLWQDVLTRYNDLWDHGPPGWSSCLQQFPVSRHSVRPSDHVKDSRPILIKHWEETLHHRLQSQDQRQRRIWNHPISWAKHLRRQAERRPCERGDGQRHHGHGRESAERNICKVQPAGKFWSQRSDS